MNPSNYSTIFFPSIGLELNPDRMISITENFSIHYYGIMIALGLMLAVIYGLRRSRQFGLDSDTIIDGVLCVVPVAVIFARLYYCAFSWETYKNNPIEILYIWNGGLAIYGGVIGAALGVIVFSRIKKIKLSAVLDLVALGFLIGQALGRWGNFFNREAFGEATESFFRMGLFNNLTQQYEYYHPTFLYESVWNALGFVLLHFLSKKRKYDGQIALGYVAWYGFGRTLIEGLRVDSLMLGSFRVSQMLAAVSCVAAVAVLLWQSFRKHEEEKLFVNEVEKAQEIADALAEAAKELEAPAEEAIQEETPEIPEEKENENTDEEASL